VILESPMSSYDENKKRLSDFDKNFDIELTKMEERQKTGLKQRCIQEFDECLRKAEEYRKQGDELSAIIYRHRAEELNELIKIL
jgi:hypothetical protein